MSGKAGIIGLGLIGGSIGIALREAGWSVVLYWPSPIIK